MQWLVVTSVGARPFACAALTPSPPSRSDTNCFCYSTTVGVSVSRVGERAPSERVNVNHGGLDAGLDCAVRRRRPLLLRCDYAVVFLLHIIVLVACGVLALRRTRRSPSWACEISREQRRGEEEEGKDARPPAFNRAILHSSSSSRPRRSAKK